MAWTPDRNLASLYQASRKLSVREAARLMFSTSEPNPLQLHKVQRWIETGVLHGQQRGNKTASLWVTTPADIAHCVRTQPCVRQFLVESGDAAFVAAKTLATMHADCDSSALRGPARAAKRGLKDFFNAVLLRRRHYGSSQIFRHLVVAGHVAAVLLVAVITAWNIAPLFQPPPPEHDVIEQWIEDQHPGRARVTKWHPPIPNPRGDGVAVQVEYSYDLSQRGKIESSQWFVIEDNQVTSVDSEL